MKLYMEKVTDDYETMIVTRKDKRRERKGGEEREEREREYHGWAF